MSAPSASQRFKNAGKYGPPEVRLLSLGQRGASGRGDPTKEEIFDIINEKNFDVLRNTPLFNVYFSNVDFGDKSEKEQYIKARRNLDDMIWGCDFGQAR